MVYRSSVESVPGAVVQGQVTAEDASGPEQAFSSAENGYPVRVAFPEDAPQDLAKVGSLAQVTVFTSDGNPINVLAEILQWISTWMNYVA